MDKEPKKLTGKGGAGRGQGRKPLAKTEPTVEITLTLPASYVERLRAIGDGNASGAVRKLVDEYKGQ